MSSGVFAWGAFTRPSGAEESSRPSEVEAVAHRDACATQIVESDEPRARHGSAVVLPALESVYQEHHPFVWRSAARLGVPDDRLPDAVHDVFLVAARRLPEFEGRSSLRTWLFAITMRVAQGIRRDRARELRHKASLELANITHGMSYDDGAHGHRRADAARTLRVLLEHLDDDKRAVFIMAELEQMTASEISAALGVKEATIYSRLRLARLALERVVTRMRAREGGPR